MSAKYLRAKKLYTRAKYLRVSYNKIFIESRELMVLLQHETYIANDVTGKDNSKTMKSSKLQDQFGRSPKFVTNKIV